MSDPSSLSTSVVMVADMTGTAVVHAVPSGHTLLDLQALGTGYTRYNHYLTSIDDGSEYRPYWDEFYKIKCTGNPAFLVIALSVQTSRAIESICKAKNLPVVVRQVKKLCNDRDVVLTAIRYYPHELCDGGILRHASAEFQSTKDIVLKAVRRSGYALEWASGAMQSDREVALAAVRQDGRALAYASVDLQRDKEVALAAVQQCGFALLFASSELQRDNDIIAACVF